MADNGVFSYSNSDHARPAEQPAPEQAAAFKQQAVKPASADQAQTPQTPFAYAETNKVEPKGAALEHLPDDMRKAREQRQAESLFSAQKQYGDAGIEDGLATVAELNDEQRVAAAAEWREAFADLDLSDAQARDVVALTRAAKASPPDETAEAAWQAEASDALRRIYGTGAEQALADARDWVSRMGLTDVLNETRMGNHPRVILLACEKARQAKARGR